MKTAPPTGTVTFLFTDIEGSTRLSQQYPEAMPALLARHHQILREKDNSQMTSEEQAYFDEQMDVLRQKMDAGQLKQIWSNGRARTMEQAVKFALEENTG